LAGEDWRGIIAMRAVSTGTHTVKTITVVSADEHIAVEEKRGVAIVVIHISVSTSAV
jgi:hypothetical protein